MPRPQKKRSVCMLPPHHRFGPYAEGRIAETVILTIDELETIRLIDFEDYNQEETAKQMLVARTTVQRIYNDARKKIAEALVGGKQLLIEGGEYELCTLDCERCRKPRRLQNRIHPIITNQEDSHE